MYKNYTIILSKSASQKLDDFADYMDKICLFRDTGIFNEHFLIENYLNSVDNFLDELKIEIPKRLEM